MIRLIFRLAIEAALFELRQLGERMQPAPIPEPAPAAPVPPESRWTSPAFHVETLRSATCPDCGDAKNVGSYRCESCRKKRAA